jgi:hypothetical protein
LISFLAGIITANIGPKIINVVSSISTIKKKKNSKVDSSLMTRIKNEITIIKEKFTNDLMSKDIIASVIDPLSYDNKITFEDNIVKNTDITKFPLIDLRDYIYIKELYSTLNLCNLYIINNDKHDKIKLLTLNKEILRLTEDADKNIHWQKYDLD